MKVQCSRIIKKIPFLLLFILIFFCIYHTSTSKKAESTSFAHLYTETGTIINVKDTKIIVNVNTKESLFEENTLILDCSNPMINISELDVGDSIRFSFFYDDAHVDENIVIINDIHLH